jgi:hypothetical protein
MPATFRFSDFHLNCLASLAQEEPTLSGELYIKDSEHSTPKWHKRWSVLYQNFLFHFENSSSGKPVGMIFLEHSTIDVVSLTKLRDLSNQVWTMHVEYGNLLKPLFTLHKFLLHFHNETRKSNDFFLRNL